MTEPLLEINDLHTHFTLDSGVVKAVDGASLTVRRGKTLAVVGESGCGKSVLARAALGIITPPGKTVAGRVLFHRYGEHGQHEVLEVSAHASNSRVLREFRGRDVAMIFQEPMASLSPVHTIGDQIGEAYRLHVSADGSKARAATIDMLTKVGLPKADERVDLYPHQLSGGMRQRAMIAMAMICRPSLLIADEPTTALDVTTQAQILKLMQDLQAETGMAIMMITHDLGVVAEMADEVAVMYLGHVVEQAPVDELFHNPSHPYTRALLRSIPRLDDDRHERLLAVPGSVPHPYRRPSGCRFHTRCVERLQYGLGERCQLHEPELVRVGDRHSARCWLNTSPARDNPVSAPTASIFNRMGQS